ncbi:hypothetical protein HYH03_005208 [Edaphochlamys debaryana]|uniref:RAP domain-containing protein n=1 Tax=Edaphochlamys debaryana TaxID=47281 RepID=A0A835Y6B1_9CHLO|nr:hypothetical protein HYH03_005208 [Edaphochlamys debaryana]|eukprot:KAG2496801.1 hypothetical protein HYH03_005208 [Edaphochlamys debaryana]
MLHSRGLRSGLTGPPARRQLVVGVGGRSIAASRRPAALRTAVAPQAATDLASPSEIVRELRSLAKSSGYRGPGRSDGQSVPTAPGRADELVAAFAKVSSRANPFDLGGAVWACSKLGTPDARKLAPQLLSALASSPELGKASNQTLCNALYAAALLSRNPTHSGKHRGSNSTVAAGRTGPNSGSGGVRGGADALLQPALSLAAACLPRLGSFTDQDTSNTWWALGTLLGRDSAASASGGGGGGGGGTSGGSPVADGKLPAGLLPGLAAAATRHLGSGRCSYRAASNMLWGAAKLGYADGPMLRVAVALFTPQAHAVASSDPRALSTAVWAVATLRRGRAEGAPLLKAAAAAFSPRLRNLDDQSLALTLWAYRNSGFKVKRLFGSAAEELRRRAPTMALRWLGQCAWALSSGGRAAPGALTAVADGLVGPSGGTAAEARLAEAMAGCGGRKPQAVANLLWALASPGLYHGRLQGALLGVAVAGANLPSFSGGELAVVAHSAARLEPCWGAAQPQQLQALLDELDRRLALPAEESGAWGPAGPRLGPRDLAMSARAVAILAPDSLTLGRLIAAAAASTAGQLLEDASPPLPEPTTDGADDDDSEPEDEDAAGRDGRQANTGGAAPYHMYGLASLYQANLVAALVAASGTAAAAAEPSGDGGPAGLQGAGDGIRRAAEVVRLAAEAMLRAERAAAAFGGGRAVSAGPDGAVQTAAETEGEGEGQGATYGPLGANPQLFRAGRNAWLLNTCDGSTTTSAVQRQMAEALRSASTASASPSAAAVSSSTAAASASSSIAAGGTAGGGAGRVVAVAEEVLSPDRMARVDLLVLYDTALYGRWLVLVHVDGPMHFAVPLGEAAAGGRGEAAGLRRLGETVLRDRILAASLGLPWQSQQAPDLYRPAASATAVATAAAVDGWAVQMLLRQLPPGPEVDALVNEHCTASLAGAVSSSEGGAAASGGGAGDLRGEVGRKCGVAGVAAVVVDYRAWMRASEDGWAACLLPLMEQVCRPSAS